MPDHITAELDTRALFAAFDALGAAVERHTKPVALRTAERIRSEQRARIRRRTGATADNIVIREDFSGTGYVVLTDDVRSQASIDRVKARRRLFGRDSRRVSTYENVPHVGLYLEYGTLHSQAHPFFWEAARLEDGNFDRGIRQAVQDAIDEVGLG